MNINTYNASLAALILIFSVMIVAIYFGYTYDAKLDEICNIRGGIMLHGNCFKKDSIINLTELN